MLLILTLQIDLFRCDPNPGFKKISSYKYPRWTNQKKIISPHQRVSLQKSNSFIKLAKQMKIKVSRNMRISQISPANIFSRSFIKLKQPLVRNARKVDANIWWIFVTWPLLLGSPGRFRRSLTRIMWEILLFI